MKGTRKASRSPAVDLESRLRTWLAVRLPSRGRVLAGVSGGADSLALLWLLVRTWPEAARRLVAVHVHHGLRGKAADRDRDLVIRQCARAGVACVVYHARVQAGPGRSLEDAGRRARLACFLDAARGLGARAVLLAHHRDDQAETLLLQLLRGAGGRGLSALQTVRPFPHPQAPPGLRLMRPLLETPRRSLQEYLRSLGVPWRTDRSNTDPRFRRNRVRRELLPRLARIWGGDVDERLARSAAILGRDEAWLERAARARLARWPKALPGAGYRLTLARLAREPEVFRGRLLSALWDRLCMPGKSYAHLRRLEELCRRGRGALTLPGRWTAACERGALALSPARDRGAAPVAEAQDPAKAYGVQTAVMPSARAGRKPPRGGNYVLADADKISGCLQVGTAGSAERIRPLGLAGKSKNVRKVISEMGVPSERRAAWPVVKMGETIIWIYQGPLSEEVKTDSNTRRVLKISLKGKII